MTTTTHRADPAEAGVPGLPRGGSGESFAVLDPATDRPLARFPLATAVDVDAADDRPAGLRNVVPDYAQGAGAAAARSSGRARAPCR